MNKKPFITILLAITMLSACVPGTDQVSSSHEQSSNITSNTSSVVGTSIPFSEVPMAYASGEDLSVIVKSPTELNATLTENEWLLAGVPNKWADFDNEFFIDNTLILHFMITTSTTPTYVLKDIRKDGENLRLYIVGEYYGNAFEEAMGFAAFVITVTKADIKKYYNFATNITYNQLDEIAPHINQGTFYVFSEAYDEGLLMIKNLQTIKNQMVGVDEALVIDEIIEDLIINDYLAIIHTGESSGTSTIAYEHIDLTRYYGEYNGSYVVVLAITIHDYPAIAINEEIGGIMFDYGLPRIQVWHKNN